MYYSSPAIGADGTIYVGLSDQLDGDSGYGKLYAVNPDGTQKWAFATGGGDTFSPRPLAPTAPSMSGQDGKLYAVNPDGTQKWAFTTGR